MYDSNLSRSFPSTSRGAVDNGSASSLIRHPITKLLPNSGSMYKAFPEKPPCHLQIEFGPLQMTL